MQKLNQVIAIEKEIKTRVYKEITELHALAKKPNLFDGFSKVYQQRYEDGENYPPESQHVQVRAEVVLADATGKLKELFDIVATKDWANCNARGDVVVDGVALIKAVPATYLLFLEKQLNDMRTLVEGLPTLDPAESWQQDGAAGLHKGTLRKTHRTKKNQKPIVLYPATAEHPAQTQLITEDETVGWWDTIKFSGALPATKKEAILKRVNKLAQAVKFAREEANSVEAPKASFADAIFNYILEAN